LYSKLPYDPVRDFSPVTMVASAPLMLVVNPSVPAKTVKDLISYAKSNPGKINYASGGIGASTHLPAELFKSMAGIDIVHIPYKGGGPALLGVISGQAQMLMISVVGALPHVKSGKLRGLALTSRSRLPELPDVPTISESAVPGYEVGLWYGVYTPKGTPRNVIMTLHGAILKTLQAREVRDRLAGDGAQPVGNTPEEFSKITRVEVAKWAKVVREAGIKAE
jgi:tripartite-type tricarboxylate transporter receptor subunit TctC